MHARLDGGRAALLTRTGLDWSHRYRHTIEALQALPVMSAYLDGELCALGSDGVPSFSRLQAAMDEGRTGELVFYAFDLLHPTARARRRCRSSSARSGCNACSRTALRFSEARDGRRPALSGRGLPAGS
jgi:ATP-dependent DNA ligase